MAKNIFSKLREHAQSLRRNTFHLSHTNNLTMPIGKYVPFLCERVMPGDTAKIIPYMGLRLMPMVFPIQTSLWCRMHFFYVRNKNLWKDWVNQMSDISQSYEMPYHKFRVSDDSPIQSSDEVEFYKVGGLADYLGIPVNYYGDFGQTISRSPIVDDALYFGVHLKEAYTSGFLGDSIIFDNYSNVAPTWQGMDDNTDYNSWIKASGGSVNYLYAQVSKAVYDSFSDGAQFDTSGSGLVSLFPLTRYGLRNRTFKYRQFVVDGNSTTQTYVMCFYDVNYKLLYTKNYSVSRETSNVPYEFDVTIDDTLHAVSPNPNYTVDDIYYVAALIYTDFTTYSSNVDDYLPTFIFTYNSSESTNVADMIINPYETDAVRINSLPARGYESIYNAFYRKTRNNPLLIDGVPVYNKYITTDEGGADRTPYKLYDAYWEDDFLTTATPTPQQGIAPLVGVTGTGLMSFQDAEGNTIYAQARLGDDGNIILGLESYDNKLPDGTLQILQDTIQSGISINDFRNVNALQRWLERNQRIGYKYKDIVKAQFGVDVDWKELDMPEFIGGVTRQFNINQISQSVEQEGGIFGSLGSIAGQGGLVGKGERISHYCDDYGYIIGIVSIVPTPVYSQLLPKHFLARGILDYYAPDFGFIGNQPITYKEVAPLQVFGNAYFNPPSGTADNLAYAKDRLNDVFGYQRAWYDYLQKVDTVHGQFRTSLRDFIINRTFDEQPILGDEFLHVDEKQVNQVFRVQDDTDKVVGEIFLDMFMKRPIPEYAIPKLEA